MTTIMKAWKNIYAPCHDQLAIHAQSDPEIFLIRQGPTSDQGRSTFRPGRGVGVGGGGWKVRQILPLQNPYPGKSRMSTDTVKTKSRDLVFLNATLTVLLVIRYALFYFYYTTDCYMDRACMSLVVRKPVFGVSDQVRHKLGCATTEDS